ncbi:SIR2 family protein [Rahnella aceris]|uniref:SIR2 family protein n=1 Tax=Rahnella sp. (strain Y9602) TaxID=2703885 RepID=UPI003BA26EE5
MAKRIISNSNALKIRINEETKPITFVLGSAISKKHNNVGIPDVPEITEFISDLLKEKGLYDAYHSFIEEHNLSDDYKSGFEYISTIFGQNYINNIIKEFVLSNVDPITHAHKIPKAVSDFTNFIKDSKCKIANIVTTNFDTLLEESFKNHSLTPDSYSLVSDSHIPCVQNDEFKIVHIHGVWNKNDSMHTHSQLREKRDKIEGSLHEIFLNTSVVIMAYGAWDDSFTRTLSNIVNIPNADYNIAWCFYSDTVDKIEEDFEKWFEKLSPAILRGRINFFRGIDCSTFFEPEQNSGLQKKK